ncbi:MAG: LamG-like jellyroll fold domain-containing protein, partial [Bacteroidota bacterium]
ALFTADNTVNFGNVSGWSINSIPPRDFYWIGGTGNWNYANHWSLSSGGAAVGCALPNRSDNVYFDSLSFSASGQYVNLNVNSDVNNFTIGNIVQGARFISGGELSIYGSTTLNRKMSFEINNVNFVSSDTIVKTIFTDSVKMRQVYFGRTSSSTNAQWSLLDNFNNNDNYLFMQYGKIITNGYNIRTYSFYAWDGGNKYVDWTGTDTVFVQNQFYANTNCYWTSRPNIVKFESTNHFYLYGGNHTFNDIIFNAKNTGDSYIEVQQNITARDININAYGTQWMTLYHQFNIRDFTFRYLNPNSRNQGLDFQVNNSTTFRKVKIYGNGLNRPSVYFRYNYTVDSLILSSLTELYFQGGYTKTIKKYMSVTGACDNRFNFRCDGSNVSLMADTGAVVIADWVILQNMKVQGVASFNATYILDLGGNTGWNLNALPTTNFYWVGGSGDWTDKNHWSFTSGGTPGTCPVPTQNDNVFFDVNSFSGANQYVNINTSVNCLNMSWNNVNYPRIVGGSDLNIYGSMTLDSKLSWQHNGWTYFRSKSTGNSINTKGVILSYTQFSGTGEWTLGDNFKATHVYVNSGSFISGGKTITLTGNFYCWTGAQTNVDLTGTDTITVANEFRIYPNNFTLNMGNAVVKFVGTNNFYLTGGNKTYTDVIFNADNTGNSTIQIDYNNTFRNLKINAAGYQTVNLTSSSTYNDVTMLFRNTTNNNPSVNVNGNNTFNDMTITSIGTAGPFIYLNNNNSYNNLIISGVGTRIFIGANQTQTVKDALALGSGSFPVFLQSTSQGTQGVISKPTGNVCMDYIWMRDIRATGGASFNAGATSVNLGNNTNWSFTSCAGYYWVGGSGNWSDYAHHWAYSSGGTILHNTPPTQSDNVFFDANSFTTAGEVITIDDAQPKMHDLSFASALYTPTIVGTVNSTEMNVYGSLKLISNMNQNFTGTWNFRAPNDSNDINTAGKTLTRVNFIGGNSGQGGWVLQNNLIVTDSINHNNGRLRFNGKEVTAKYYTSNTSNTRILDLGSSIINIVDGEWNPSNLTNFTFIKGTSEIILKGSANSNFYGNGLTYNKVTFRPTTSMNSLLTGANTFAKLRFEGGVNASLEPVIQNATQFEFSGTCAKQIGIQSTINGTQATFRQTSGSVVGTFLNLKDIVGNGGATFTANQSQNLGNNSGWTYSTAPSISISLTSGLVNCSVNNDGWAKVSVLQGKSPYTYLWSTNETTDSISHLIPGVYSVTVRDSNGCAASDAVSVVNLPSALSPVNWNASAFDICQGTTINFTPNEVSTAIHFDGVNDYIQASHISALNATNLTIEAWVKADSTQADYATIIDKGSDTTSGNGWILQFNGSNGNVRFWSPGGTLVSTTNIKDKQWHHLAASYDGTNYKLYVDGALENTVPSSNGIVNNSSNLLIGNSLMGNMNFSGLIDEVRVWNVARTQSQIQVNRTKDLLGNESGLTAYYNMEYNAGTSTLRDLTSNANNGTLTNMNPSSDWVNPGAVNSTISYLWNFGDFTTSALKTPSKLFSTPGSYTVSLGTFDKNGCPNYINKTIRVSQVTYNVVKTNIPCKGTNNGSILITAAGGIPPYTYSINNGASYSNNASFTGLAAGNYQVIVKDSIGCTSSVQTFTISQPDNVLAYSISQNSPICIGTTAGTINVSATGGTSPYQYSKNTGISYQSASLFDVLGAGNYSIRVRDANNCIATDQSVSITEVDSIKPVFSSCPSNIVVNAGANCTAVVNYSTPTATDNCKTPSVIRTAGLASGSAFALGTTTVTYLANDSNGNTKTCSFTVTVNDATAPTVLTRNINAQLNGAGTVSITASQINNNSYDNCSIDSIKVYPSSFTCANKGNNTVTLWIRDASGNIGTNTATVTVQDVTAPDLVCKPDTLVLDGNGNASIASYTELVQSLSDNCGVTQTAISKSNFNASNIGSNTVVLTVQDASNNISSCSTTVVVVEPSPIAICRNKTIYLDNTGNASIIAADLDNGSHSSIGISNRTISKSSFNCTNVGVNYDTLTVFNAFNRSAYCVATVTVLDTIKPSVVARNLSVYLNSNGSASITANQIDNGSSDICGIATKEVTPSSFTCSN